MGILKVCGAFVLVILALLIFLKILGRFARGKSFRGGKEFVLKATMSMDSKKYLAAVEIDGRLLILAVAGDRVTPLAHWASREPAGFGDDLDVGALDLESRGDKGANVAGPAAPTGASVSFEKP
jgi:hypothetical protein